MPQGAPDSVRFYTLSTMPNSFRKGAFLNLTQPDQNNKEGLYFCDGTRWRYLIHTEVEITSAVVYNNSMYFYHTTPPPLVDGSDSDSEPDLGDYVFSVQLPELIGGSGIGVSNFYNIDIDLAQSTVYENTTLSHTGSENLLTIDEDNKLTIGDTWRCGVYYNGVDTGSDSDSDSDNRIKRHVSHLLTENLVYEFIYKKNIPDGVTVYQEASVPTNPTSSSHEYIKRTSDNHYFRLVGKKPLPSSILDGEIAISTAKGFERLYIKNNQDEIVEFKPAGRLNEVYNATFTNQALTSTNSACVWEIPYSDIISEGIGVYGAVVFLRENTTGKQLIPDVVFDGTNSKVIITLYSTSNIAAGKYTAIVMGSNYNNIPE